jgi:hypothetical protein
MRKFRAREAIQTALEDHAVSGVRAAELLGKDREVNIWQSDTAIGIFNMPIPQGWESHYLTPETIDAVAQSDPKILPAKFEPISLWCKARFLSRNC